MLICGIVANSFWGNRLVGSNNVSKSERLLILYIRSAVIVTSQMGMFALSNIKLLAGTKTVTVSNRTNL